MSYIKQSTSFNTYFTLVSSTDHVTGVAGVTPTIQAAKNGGVYNTIAPTVTDLSNGNYVAALTAAHTDTMGELGLFITGAGVDPVNFVHQVVAFDPTDATRFGLSALPNANAGANGGLPTGDASGRVALQSGTGTGQIILNSGQVSASNVTGSVGSVAGNVAGVVTGSVGSVLGNVAGSVTGSVGSVAGNVAGSVTGSVGSISGVSFPTNFPTLSIQAGTGYVTATNGGGGGGGGNGVVQYIVEVGTSLPSETLYLNAGIAGPAIRYTLKDAAFRAIPYAANTSVRFLLTPYASNTPTINTATGVTLTDPAGGVVTFDWSSASVTTPNAGDYKMQFLVNGTLFPIGGFILTKVA